MDELVGRFIKDGRLVIMPSKRSKLRSVLDHIAQDFEPGRTRSADRPALARAPRLAWLGHGGILSRSPPRRDPIAPRGPGVGVRGLDLCRQREEQRLVAGGCREHHADRETFGRQVGRQ